MHSDIFYFISKIICWSQSTKLILQLANGENWQLEKQRYDAIFPVTGKTTEVLEGLLRSPVVESQSLAHKPVLDPGHWEAVTCNTPPSSGHQGVSSSWPGPPSPQPSPVSSFSF